jgi:hypothetical protein
MYLCSDEQLKISIRRYPLLFLGPVRWFIATADGTTVAVTDGITDDTTEALYKKLFP